MGTTRLKINCYLYRSVILLNRFINSQVSLNLNISVDLSSVFNWKTKQVLNSLIIVISLFYDCKL